MGIEQILVVDDEPLTREFLCETLRRSRYEVVSATDGMGAIQKLKRNPFDLVLTDMKMPRMDGLKLLENVKRISPDTVVIMMTAHGTVETAVEAMKRGAYDYIVKPFSPDEIELTIKKVSEQRNLINENRYLRSELEERYGFGEVIGSHPKIQRIFATVRKIAVSKATVLIQGESGTGKELIARAIHFNSPRRDKPFVKVNCAALPEGLLESELFGHEKGSFTGAIGAREGRFELADRGTLFLDEVSEISPALQAKLLRVLQEREFERVGGIKSIKVDVRLISTTNRNLRKAMREGSFREDLFYRLNVVPLFLPPLRERKEDIPALATHFLQKYSRENNRKVESVSPEALNIMMEYDWPGNIRELENAMERAIVMDVGKVILPEHLSLSLSSDDDGEREENIGIVSSLEDMERQLILKTLKQEGGHKSRTAEKLGISIRTLRNKLNLYKQEALFGNF